MRSLSRHLPRVRAGGCSLGILILAAHAAAAVPRAPRLTIYNQDFAVVRQHLILRLKQGINRVRFTQATAMLAPGSVILRDRGGRAQFTVLEQNYRADPASERRLLRRYVGKTIKFLVSTPQGSQMVSGRIIRAGWMPPNTPYNNYPPHGNAPMTAPARRPIIEVNGLLRFGLPGQPLFPALPPGSILQPILTWHIASRTAARIGAELNYVTGGLNWAARYNAVESAAGGRLSIYGWDMLRNWSGRSFRHAHIELMAGTVRNLAPKGGAYGPMVQASIAGTFSGNGNGVGVTQTPFDVYHLYTLARRVTLRSGESKQLEFLRAAGVAVRRYYIYDGVKLQPYQANWGIDSIRNNGSFGTQSTHKVKIVRSFANTRANHLGVPLPAGRLRFYREDRGGQLQYLGETRLPNMPAGQAVRAYTGAAFDLWGNRHQTNFSFNMSARSVRESFRIRLRNHRPQPVDIRVIEHLYRGNSWQITAHSDLFLKRDSRTIEFRVEVPAHGQKVITYSVHYFW